MAVYSIGVDIGGTHTRAVLGDEEGFVTKPRKAPTQNVLSRLDSLITETLREAAVARHDLAGVGIAVPGLVDPSKKTTYSVYLGEVSFAQLEAVLGLPVEVENDANAAAIGEKFYGHGQGVDNLTHVIMGTGIGAGVYVNNRLIGSSRGGRRAGEIGFFVVDSGGLCEAGGKKGVWQAYCSGSGIPKFVGKLLETEQRETRLKGKADLKAEDVFRHAAEGDAVAVDYVTEIYKLNAIGFATLINTFAPQLITVGGSVAVNNPRLLDDVRQRVKDYAVNPVPEIRMTKLGDDAGLYGAVRLGLGEEI